METVELRDEEWFIDERLEEVRSKAEPWKAISFDNLSSSEALKVFDASQN